MLRHEFLVRYIMFVIGKSTTWLAEEDTEAGHLQNMQDMTGMHNSEIQQAIASPLEGRP